MPDNVSRRDFLAAAGAVLGVAPVLAACGGTVEASGCNGYSTLSEPELQQRASLNYVDVTPVAGERCDNCRFYNAPTGGSPCGGCQLFAGPVAPAGYCTGWVATA